MLCDNTIGSIEPAPKSTQHDIIPTAIPRACGILLMDVRMLETYLNVHTQYLAETSVQAALTKYSKINTSTRLHWGGLGNLSRQVEIGNVLSKMDKAKWESQIHMLGDEQHI